MAAVKNARWYWLTSRDKFDSMSALGALDLVRYDGARVESNAPDGYVLFSAPAETHPRGPEVNRLRSHGAPPDWVIDRPVSHDLGSSRAWEWFHANAPKKGSAAP